MKRLAFILLSALAISSVGCNKNTTPVPAQSMDILFTGDIERGDTEDVGMQNAVTRAETTKSRTAFNVGDSIGVFVVPFKNTTTQGDLIASGNYADNVAFVRDLAGVFAPGAADRITFPTATSHISIYAFAMYSAQYKTLGANPKAQIYKVATDQSATSGVAIVKNDVMTAQALDVAPGTKPDLQFAHRMAMVRVDFKTLAAYRGGTVTSASLTINNVITDATIDMTNNSVAPVTNGSVKNDIKAYQFSSAANAGGGLDCVFEAIVVPQAISAGTVGVTVTLTTASPVGTYDFKCEMPSEVLYSSGNLTKIALKFDTEYQLTMTSALIKPWGDGGSANVDARKPAVMNFKIAADPNSKAATVRYADLGIDGETYTADVVKVGNILCCTYMQPENKVGDKLKSLVLKDVNRSTIVYQNANPAINSAGVIIFGDPTQQGYAEIISQLTFN